METSDDMIFYARELVIGWGLLRDKKAEANERRKETKRKEFRASSSRSNLCRVRALSIIRHKIPSIEKIGSGRALPESRVPPWDLIAPS